MPYSRVSIPPHQNYFDAIAENLTADLPCNDAVVHFKDVLVIVEEQAYSHLLLQSFKSYATVLASFTPYSFTQWALQICSEESRPANNHITRLLLGMSMKTDSNPFNHSENLISLFNDFYQHIPGNQQNTAVPYFSNIDFHDSEIELCTSIWDAWQDYLQSDNTHNTSWGVIRHYFDRIVSSGSSYQKIVVIGHKKPSWLLQQWLASVAAATSISHYVLDFDDQVLHDQGFSTKTDRYNWQRDARDESKSLFEKASLKKVADASVMDHLSIKRYDHQELMIHNVVGDIHDFISNDDAKIVIIASDRKLMRRLYASLQNQGISVTDPSGWTLSSTSAGTLCEQTLHTTLEKEGSAVSFQAITKKLLTQLEQVSHWQGDIGYEVLLDTIESLLETDGWDAISGSKQRYWYWIRSVLETEFLRVPASTSQVQFANAEITAHLEDAVILFLNFSDDAVFFAGHENLFLNDAKRRLVGLPTASIRWEEQTKHLTRILAVNKKIWVYQSATTNNHDNPIPARFFLTLEDYRQARAERSFISDIKYQFERSQPQSLPEDHIPETMKFPASISAGGYLTFRKCRVKYYLQSMLQHTTAPNEKQLFGIRFHEMLSLFHTTLHDDSVAQGKSMGCTTQSLLVARLQSAWEHVATHTILDQVYQISLQSFFESYSECLTENPPVKLYPELTVSKAFSALTVSGRVDLLTMHQDGSYAVTEFKSGKLPTQISMVSLEEAQLFVYGLLCNKPDPLLRMVNLEKIIAFPSARYSQSKVQKQLDVLQNELEELSELVGKDIPLTRTTNSNHCSSCEFNRICLPSDRRR